MQNEVFNFVTSIPFDFSRLFSSSFLSFPTIPEHTESLNI